MSIRDEKEGGGPVIKLALIGRNFLTLSALGTQAACCATHAKRRISIRESQYGWIDLGLSLT